MKRFLSLVLVLSMLFAMVSCAKVERQTETETKTSEETQTTKTQEIEKGHSEGVFAVGFSRKDMTPQSPAPLAGYANPTQRLSKTIKTRVAATCVAIKDANGNIALIYTLDLCYITKSCADTIIGLVSKATGVPEGNIMFACTHTHEAPVAGGINSAEATNWLKVFYPAVRTAALDAIADLDKAEMFETTTHVKDLNFIRRYKNKDGTYASASDPKDNVVAYETEIDDELQLIKFERENKEPVLLVNWRAHPCYDSGETASVVSADYIHYMREKVEAAEKCKVAFYQAAQGNVGSKCQAPATSPIYVQSYSTADDYGKKLSEEVLSAMSSLTKIEVGDVKATSQTVTLKIDHSEDYKADKAQIVSNLMSSDTAEARAKATEFGFDSMWHANAVYEKSRSGETFDITLWAISIGDAAFVFAPYEMFDMTGRDIKNASPFKHTFVCVLTNGYYNYFPAAECFPHRGYEICQFRYVKGSAEQCRDALIDMLKVLHG